MGALYARVAGAVNPITTMPSNIALFPRSVSAEAGERIMQFGDLASGGEVGAGFAPVVPGAGGGFQEDLKLHLPQARLGDRCGLLAAIDDWRRRFDQSAVADNMDAIQQQAFGTLLGRLSDAFDLAGEDPRIVARYDTAPLVPRERISTKWKNHPHYCDHAATLGKLLLMARRLCERGCGFVTVTTSFVWDMHADVNNATMSEGMGYVGTPFDHAVSTLSKTWRRAA
jgi:hypothetical protein